MCISRPTGAQRQVSAVLSALGMAARGYCTLPEDSGSFAQSPLWTLDLPRLPAVSSLPSGKRPSGRLLRHSHNCSTFHLVPWCSTTDDGPERPAMGRCNLHVVPWPPGQKTWLTWSTNHRTGLRSANAKSCCTRHRQAARFFDVL